MNVQCSLIQGVILYEFELGDNAAEVSKNISYAMGEGTVNHCTVTRSFKEFCLGCKNLDDQVGSGRPKGVDLRLCSKP